MAPQPTAPTPQPPPELPADPKVSDAMVNYFRAFALWCRNGFRDKLSANSALPGILLAGHDTTGHPTNATYLLQVQMVGSTPTVVVTLVPAGSGAP